MLHVITGGSGSGKSAYAEQQVLQAGEGRRVYIATMVPYGEEGRQRVARHRRLRQEKQFVTVECFTSLHRLKLNPEDIVLLECMSNLVANEMYEPGGAGDDAPQTVLRGLMLLRAQVRHLFVVTNEVFSDGLFYSEETQKYLRYLGAVNREMAACADRVTEVVYGIPVPVR